MLYKGIVNLHKRSLERLVSNSSVEITLRDAAPVVSVGVNPYYGSFNRETSKAGATHGPFRCLWYDALALGRRSKNLENTVEQLAGQFREADCFAELILNDVLVDQNDSYGLTLFDRCQWVINDKKRYKFLGSTKFSLANSAPYAIIVALKGAVNYIDE